MAGSVKAYGELIIIAGRVIASPGVPSYRGSPRLRVSWARSFFRVDCFGHGFWLAPGKKGLW
jgi:hypothetical protein